MLEGWCAGRSLGLLGSQSVPGKEEWGPDTQDPWGKVQAERFGVLFFPQRQLKSGDMCRESCGPTHLVLQHLSRDRQVPSKG